jgi:hypothetical protein
MGFVVRYAIFEMGKPVKGVVNTFLSAMVVTTYYYSSVPHRN